MLNRFLPTNNLFRLRALRALHNAADDSSLIYSAPSVDFLLGGILPAHLDPLDVASRTTRHDVLDLGAGAGARSQAIIAARPDLKVVGVDPLAAMCAKYAQHLPNVDVLQGSGEGIPLLDNSVYATVVGQAFRGFATAATLAEISRVLVPGGGLGMIWNTPDTSVPWVQALEDILQPYSLEDSQPHTDEWQTIFDTTKNYTTSKTGDPLFQPLETRTFHKVDQNLTYDDVLNHTMALPVVVNQNKTVQETIAQQVRELMHEHPGVCQLGSLGQPTQAGRYAMPYVTELHVTRNLKAPDALTLDEQLASRIDPEASKALGLDVGGEVGRVGTASAAGGIAMSVKKIASEALQLDDFFGSGTGPIEEEDEDDDDDFVDFTDPTTGEWNSPTKGGRMPEPTRHGDWHHKGRCTDFS